MKIVVLNGSPKGDMSITMQYVEFIRKKYRQHTLQQFNVARHIKKLEQDKKYFHNVISKVAEADGVIWAFPVYYFLVPSQYKKFIELIFERDKKGAFRNKYTVSLSTSVHFFDHTAHNYIHAICDDLEMRYVDRFSADMYDLLKKKWQDTLIAFADNFFTAIKQKRLTQPVYAPLNKKRFIYEPRNEKTKINTKDKSALIITDTLDQNTNLGRMVNRLRNSLSGKVEVISLDTLDIQGGCVGCIQCGYNNTCIYDKYDTFSNFLKRKLIPVDMLIYAGTIKDRFLSSAWKLFFDRCFSLGHIPLLKNKQIGYVISGALCENKNLRQFLEAYGECTGANIAGFVTDEQEESETLNELLQVFAETIIRFAHIGYKRPYTFLSIGGRKVLRDDVVWGRLRFVFQADHRYYKRHGLYDFSQRDIKSRVINIFMMLMTKIPGFRRRFTKKIRKLMVMPHRKTILKMK